MRQNPTSLHQLLQLDREEGFVSRLASGPVLWWVKLDQLVVNLNTLIDLESVRVVQVGQFLFIVGLFGILDREHLHEEVSGVAASRDVELEGAEVLHRLSCVALEYSETVCHQNESVEVEEGFRTW